MARVEPRVVRVRGGVVMVRSAVVEDAAALLEHRRRSAMQSPHIISEASDVDPDVEKQRAWILERTEHRGHLTLVAEPAGDWAEPGRIISTLTFTAGSRRKIAHQGTFGIGTDPEWRGRGVGTALIETLLDWAAAHPVLEKVCLGVFSRNEGARVLYRRLGFVEEGRLLRFVKHGPGEYDDDISMCIYVKDGVAPEGYRVWRGRATVAK
jgi:RimJ/RimL family protein N-acetyltransferase